MPCDVFEHLTVLKHKRMVGHDKRLSMKRVEVVEIFLPTHIGVC